MSTHLRKPKTDLAEEPLEASQERIADASTHQLRPDVVTLPQSVVIGVATSAPGQSTAVALAGMVAVAAYATGPAILLSMLPMLAIALCYQRLNLWNQNCGGPYVWVAKAISPYVGYLVGWSMLVGFVLGSVSNILPLGPAMLSFAGLDASGTAGNMVTATVFGLVLTAIAAVGIRATARFQLAIASIEYVTLLVFSGIAFWAVFVQHRPGSVHPNLSWLHVNGVGGRGSLAGAMLIAIFLFTGWDASIYINEETTHKRHNPGKAAIISVAILGPVFAWLFVSFQGVVPPGQLQSHATDALPFLAQVLVGGGWAKFMVLAVVLSVLGTTQATIVSTSRVTYSMGTDRLLPSRFGKVHPRFRTPMFATVFWGLAMVAVADLYVASSSLASAFNDVVNAEAIAFTIFYIMTALATTWYYRSLLRRSLVDAALVGVFPLCGAAVLAWVLARSIPALSPTARWTVAGVGILGVVLMCVSAWVLRSSFFRIGRSRYSADSAS
jgi:amino acid transporter